MALLESDISWQLLRRIVHDWAGTSAELAEVKPLTGGSISTTLALITTDGQRCVLKISPHRVDRSYQDEAAQLLTLAGAGRPARKGYKSRLGTLEGANRALLTEYVD